MTTKIEGYRAGWFEDVTDCCGVNFSWGGGYSDFYKKCPECGGGNLYWPVNVVSIYHPSSLEEELLKRVQELERKLG